MKCDCGSDTWFFEKIVEKERDSEKAFSAKLAFSATNYRFQQKITFSAKRNGIHTKQ